MTSITNAYKVSPEIAGQALRQSWPENLETPTETTGDYPVGTIDVTWDETGPWRRVACADGVWRQVPSGTFIKLNPRV